MESEPAGYCWQCGLPQLRVSAPVLEAAETRTASHADAGDRTVSSHTLATDSAALEWPLMLRILLVAAAAGLLPCLVLRDALFSGSVGIPVLFLLPVLCLASVFVYVRRRPHRRMSAAAGAQTGLALGTMLAFAVVTVTAITSFALRYQRHNTSLEQSFGGIMQQAEAQVRISQPNAPAGLLTAMRSPEWHAGWFLTMEGAVMLMLMLGGCVAGLVAGALLRARQDAT